MLYIISQNVGPKCLQQVRQLSASVGATIDEESLEFGTIIVDAPAGYVWNANGAASLSEPAENSMGQKWYRQACGDLIASMKMGLHLCSPEESADIEYDRDEPWTAPPGSPQKLEVRL